MKNDKKTSVVNPVAGYAGIRYPTIKQLRETIKKTAATAKHCLVPALCATLVIPKQSNAADKAAWTFEPDANNPEFIQPLPPITYATACYHGPVWDSDEAVVKTTLKDIAANPSFYKNEMLWVEGTMQTEERLEFGNKSGYTISDATAHFKLWLEPRFYNPVEIDTSHLGTRIIVIGELKFFTLQRYDSALGFVYTDVWGIIVEEIKTTGTEQQ